MVVKHGTRTGRRPRRFRRVGQPAPLTYWRKLAAGDFNTKRRAEVSATVAKFASTLPEWNAAIAGNAGAAIGLVLRLRPPFRVCARIDLAMTVLLNCAFESAGAAVVLSWALHQMPLHRSQRARLSQSWTTTKMTLAKPGRPIRDRPDRTRNDEVLRPRGGRASRDKTRPGRKSPC